MLDKLVTVVAGDQGIQIDHLIESLNAILIQCYLVRMAHANLAIPLEWIAPHRSCSVGATDQIDLDRDSFVNKLLNKANAHERYSDVMAEIDRLAPALGTADFRNCCHGHDTIDLLAWYLAKCGHGWLRRPDQLARAMVGCLAPTELGAEPLFAELVRRLCRYRE